MIVGMLNPAKKFDMNTLQICPPYLPNVATLPWEIQKSHFLALVFIYLRLFTLSQKKTDSNGCTAALAVYLLLFNASYYPVSYTHLTLPTTPYV